MRSPIECNLYSYARNNPVKYVDPTGQWAFQLGVKFDASGIVNIGIEGGFAISMSDSGDFELGVYSTDSIGLESDIGFTAQIQGGFTQDAQHISDLSGGGISGDSQLSMTALGAPVGANYGASRADNGMITRTFGGGLDASLSPVSFTINRTDTNTAVFYESGRHQDNRNSGYESSASGQSNDSSFGGSGGQETHSDYGRGMSTSEPQNQSSESESF